MSAGLWGALAGAGLGALQYGDKKRQNEHDRKVAAETARWSPWTNMKPQAVEAAPSLIGTLGQGAIGGANFGQQFAKKDNDLAAQQAGLVPQAEAPQGAALVGEDPMALGTNGAPMSPMLPPGYQQQSIFGPQR